MTSQSAHLSSSCSRSCLISTTDTDNDFALLVERLPAGMTICDQRLLTRLSLRAPGSVELKPKLTIRFPCLRFGQFLCVRRMWQSRHSHYQPHVGTLILISLIYSLTARVVGAPQMISQPVSPIFPCSPPPSETWRTPGLFIP